MKKLIGYLGTLCLLVLINISFWNVVEKDYYTVVDLKMVVSSEQDVLVQMFVSGGEAFSEDNSQTILCTANQENELIFQLPAATKYFRIDFGNVPGEIQINRFYLEVKGIEKDLLANFGDLSITYNMVDVNNHENDVVITSIGDDPFLVFEAEQAGLQEVVDGYKDRENVKQKVALCVVFDGICLAVFFSRKKLFGLYKDITENKGLILDLAKNDFKTKYAGSYLGIIWAFVQPIVTILVYWFVFQVGFRSGSIDGVPFVLWLTAGLVPWFFFNEALNSATSSLLDYSYLVKKVVFNISIIPPVRILSALFVHAFFVAFMLYMFLLNGMNPSLEWLQLIYYSFCLILLLLGITYLTSALVIFFRDLAQIIIVVLQIGMWMTPIMWNWEILPSNLHFIFKLNPMYYIVQGYRDAMIYHKWFWNNTYLTIYFWIVTVACLYIGNRVFNKLKIHFADMI